MFFSEIELAFLVLLGLVIGFISSILGLGGGVLIVPLLPLVRPVSHYEILGTSLASIFLIVTMNTWSYHRKGLVDWKMALTAGPISALAAFAAGKLAYHIPEIYLKGLLALVLFVFALKVILQKTKPQVNKSSLEEGSAAGVKMTGVFLMAGVAAGLVSGLSGIGAGLILGPLMIHLGLTANEKISPTQNGVMMFTTLFAAMAYAGEFQEQNWQWGDIHLSVVVVLVACASITSFFGRRLQGRLGIQGRRLILGVMLLLLSLKTIYSVVLSNLTPL